MENDIKQSSCEPVIAFKNLINQPITKISQSDHPQRHETKCRHFLIAKYPEIHPEMRAQTSA